MNKESIKISRFLSKVLRHNPEIIGLKLDENGWVSTQKLIDAVNTKFTLDMEMLKEIVETNDKKRFKFSGDFSEIRANQGHSIDIDLDLKEQEPPNILFHGTASKNIESIKINGITKQKRQHVHLSSDIETATKVGSRHGIPLILFIDTEQMFEDGCKFFKSDNGVWLTDNINPKYII